MADVVVVANDLLRSGTTGSVRAVEFGEAITAGQMLYQDGTDQKYYLAVATDPTKPANTGQLAISLTTAAADQTGVVARTDTQIDFGATAPLTQGEVYVLSSANAGGIAPVADLAIASTLTILGYAISTEILLLGLNVTGVAKA
jgi:hypothetical protein